MEYMIKVCNLLGQEMFSSIPVDGYKKNDLIDKIRCNSDALVIPLKNGSCVIPNLSVQNYIFHIVDVVAVEEDNPEDLYVEGICSLILKTEAMAFSQESKGLDKVSWIKKARKYFGLGLKEALDLYEKYSIQ